jgi:hypothetical protein
MNPPDDNCMPGLLRVGGVVILTGPALRSALECAFITVKHRGLSGLPNQRYEALARELHTAVSAAGQSDVPKPAACEPVSVVQPTVPISEAATRLGISSRQTRRLAPRLAGQIVGGRWLVDEVALREHEGGRWTAKSRRAS